QRAPSSAPASRAFQFRDEGGKRQAGLLLEELLELLLLGETLPFKLAAHPAINLRAVLVALGLELPDALLQPVALAPQGGEVVLSRRAIHPIAWRGLLVLAHGPHHLIVGLRSPADYRNKDARQRRSPNPLPLR